ncbi:MAG: agmatinase [Thermodesulfobacteriota bacterium]
MMATPPFIPFGGPRNQTPGMEQADVVILPLCYEHAPSYGGGSGEGPLHLLTASEQLESFDEELLVDWSRFRIHTMEPLFPAGDPLAAVMQMKQAAAAVLSRRKFLLSLGGDHAITIGPVMAVAEAHPDAGVLQVDAHLDLRDEWNGSPYNHACVMRRISDDIGLPFVQVGIRSFSREEAEYVEARGLSPFYAHDLDPRCDDWVAEALARLPAKVYLSIDLDGLDPAVVPGTGTPEPGGLDYRQLLRLIRALTRSKKLVAADINELAKIPGTQVSEIAAARLAAKILVYGKQHGAF